MTTKNNKHPRDVYLTETYKITSQQARFAEYYILDEACFGAPKKAYLKAYKATEQTADAHSYKLLKNIGIRRYMKDLLEEHYPNEKIDALAFQKMFKSDIRDSDFIRLYDSVNKLRMRLIDKIEVKSSIMTAEDLLRTIEKERENE